MCYRRLFLFVIPDDNQVMKLSQLIDEFLLYLESVRGLSSNTIISYRNDLNHLMEFLSPQMDIKDVTKENLLLSIGQLSKKQRASASVNRFIAAVRTLFSYGRNFGYLEKNPAIELKTVRLPKKMPRFMTSTEVTQLCNQPLVHELLWETRDKCIFDMLYSSGCRASEIINLKLSDFIEGYHKAIVRGKGNKDRVVYFEKDAQTSLEIYLPDRKKCIESNNIQTPTERVFINQKGLPLTTGGLRYILNRYSGPEGINHHVNPHAFRHTFATTMIGNGADVRLVQEMLGHANISTTQRYTHLTTEKLIETYKKAHPHSSDE